MSQTAIYKAFDAYLAEMGQNAPKSAGEREIFRRLFVAGYGAGWQDAEDVGVLTHLLRLLHWQ